MRVFASYAILLFFAVLILSAQASKAAVGVLCGQSFEIVDGSDALYATYCGTLDLVFGDPYVTRAVVVIHGSSRNSDDYLRYVEDAGLLAVGADLTSAIIAPQFLTDADIDAFNLPSDTLYWSSSGWKQGNTSNASPYPRPFNISSFEVVDLIIERLADDADYPNITEIVVVGHSAGGQFTQRYAAGGRAESAGREGLSFRYVFANPSSYMYFSPERAVNGTLDVFETPKTKRCGGYDNYKYGLDNLNSYMGAVGAEGLKARYQGRRTVTFLGEYDDDPKDSSLDNGCAAKRQGAHRLERGRIYFNHTLEFFGAQIEPLQSMAIAPAVAHSAREMFQSDCGLKLIYDYDPDGDACTYVLSDGGGGDGGGGNGGGKGRKK